MPGAVSGNKAVMVTKNRIHTTELRETMFHLTSKQKNSNYNYSLSSVSADSSRIDSTNSGLKIF